MILKILQLIKKSKFKHINNRQDMIFSKIGSTFGVGASRILYLNSKKEDGNVKDIWSQYYSKFENFLKHKKTIISKQEVGQYLSSNDISVLASIIESILVSGILPHLEKKIKLINNQVVLPKKSLKSQFFGLFQKKKSKEGDKYSFDSPEIQMRRMADYCFMMRDYETALGVYKLVYPDFKTNKDIIHTATCYEIIAWTTYLSGGSKKEVENYFTQAFTIYKQEKCPNFAMRCCLSEAMFALGRGDYIQAGEAYRKATTIEGRGSTIYGLLHEQSGICYLNPSNPMFRKYAFSMIIAGARFMNGNQMGHAFRTYSHAVLTYQKLESWDDINDHLNESLSKLSYAMGDTTNAIQRVHDLLKDSNDESSRQKSFYNDFLTYSKEKENSKLNLSIPYIEDNDVKVFINDYGKPTSTDEIPPSTWQTLEESLLKSLGKKNLNFKWDKFYQNPKFFTVVKKESFQVQFTLKNNLDIEIPIENLKLLIDYKPLEDTNNFESIYIESMNLTLRPREIKKVKLEVTPFFEGELKVLGIEWLLSGIVKGKKMFNLKGKRKNDTKQDRQGTFYEEDNRLNLKIISEQPNLNLFLDFPSKLYEGEYKQVQFIFKNISSKPIKNIYFKTNNSNLFSLKLPSENVQESKMNLLNVESYVNENQSFYKVNLENAIELNQSLTLIGYIRCPNLMNSITNQYSIDFNLLIYYDSGEEFKLMPYRLFKLSKPIQIERLLQITPFSQKSIENLGEYTIGLTISNLTKTSVQLSQVSSVSPMFTFEPLNDMISQLDSEESCNLFFKILKLKEKGNTITNLKISKYIQASEEPFKDLLFRNYLNESGFTSRLDSELTEIELEKKRTYPIKQEKKTFFHLPNYPFLESNGFIFELFWETEDRKGQSIIELNFQPQQYSKIVKHLSSYYPTNKNLQNPIQISLEYQEKYNHDFKQGCLFVPIKLILMNHSPDMKCENLIVNFNSPETKREVKQKIMYTTPYIWIGTTRASLKELKPNQIQEVGIRAVFFGPGTYNLNHFKVSHLNSNFGEEQHLSFDFSQFLIMIE